MDYPGNGQYSRGITCYRGYSYPASAYDGSSEETACYSACGYGRPVYSGGTCAFNDAANKRVTVSIVLRSVTCPAGMTRVGLTTMCSPPPDFDDKNVGGGNGNVGGSGNGGSTDSSAGLEGSLPGGNGGGGDPPGECAMAPSDNSIFNAILATSNPFQLDEHRSVQVAGMLAGNPINIGSGNKYQVQQIYSGAGVFPLQLSLYYNSNISARQSAWGYGWSSSLDMGITEEAGKIKVARPDGRRYTFTPSANLYTSTPDVSATLSWRYSENGAINGWRYHSEEDITEIYDNTGKLLARYSPSGHAHHYSYDSQNRLLNISDTSGRTITLERDGSGRISAMLDPDGQRYAFVYDAKNNLGSLIWPDTLSRTLHYDDSRFPHALTGITDENGAQYATYAYDQYGRGILTEHAEGAGKVTLQYDAVNSLATVIDAHGNTTKMGYQLLHGRLQPTNTEEPCSNCVGGKRTSLRQYDAKGNLSVYVNYAGVRTEYSYEVSSRNLLTKLVAASGKPEQRTVHTEWHPIWRMKTRIAEPNRITRYVYNGQADADNQGALAQCAPNTAQNEAGLLPLLCKKTEQATADLDGSQGFAATALGTPRIWNYSYDASGQRLAMDGPRQDVSDVTTYSYYPWDDACSNGQTGCRGNIASITDAVGHQTRFTQYDAHGRVTEIIDSKNASTQLTYDIRGRLTSVNQGMLLTSYLYDAAGLLKQVDLPDGSKLHYSYDSAHRLTTIADGLGNNIRYTLDGLGNRIKEETLDLNGALARIISRSYGALNRLQQVMGGQ